MDTIIDLSHPIENGMPVFPGDTSPVITHQATMQNDICNGFGMRISMHTGTHADAPYHMLETGARMNELPPDRFYGAAVVLEMTGSDVLEPAAGWEEKVVAGAIVLLRTGWSRYWGEDRYYRDYPSISEAFCRELIARGVKLIGMDTPSPDHPPYPVHKELFAAGVLLVENLRDMDGLPLDSSFLFSALPLRVPTAGCPVRAVAILRDGTKI